MKAPISSETKIVKNLVNLFSVDKIDCLANEVGFIKRKRKLSAFAFVLLLVFEIRRSSIESLNKMTIGLEKEGIFMSKQGINYRFSDSAVAFMKKLTFNLLAAKLDRNEVLANATHFERIMVKDSTVFQLPDEYADKYKGSGGGASTAGMKIQLEYNLKSNDGLDIEPQPANIPDVSSKLEDLRANDLRLEDLGYSKLSRFEEIIHKSAYFLSRHKYSTTVFELVNGEYKRIDIDKLIKQMKPGQVLDIKVFLGNIEKLPVRLILERVPDEIAAAKRRKLKSDKQNKRKSLSKSRLDFCDVNAFITNADREILPTETIRSIYTLRWQVEIAFKVWKSTFKLDKVKPMKVQRFDCINYATLIQILISTRLYDYYKTHLWNTREIELSELKAFQYLQEVITEIGRCIKQSQIPRIPELLITTKEILARKCKKEIKKGSKSPMQIMSQMSLT